MLLSKTIVALLKNKDEVNRLVDELQGAGISGDTIKVVDEGQFHTQERLDESETQRPAGMLGLLKRLFGIETQMNVEPASPLYTDWVRNGGFLVAVNTDADHADKVVELMERYRDTDMTSRMAKAGLGTAVADSSRLERAKESLRGIGERIAEKKQSLEERFNNNSEEEIMPVIQEELHVGKRQVQRSSIRVVKHVTETPVEETINLHDETVIIDRHPVDRIANEADIKGLADSRVEMTEIVEEPVVSKEARVVEEIRISRKGTDHLEKIKDRVRRTSIDIEGLDPVKLRDMDFRNDFGVRFGKLGHNYVDYAPAYELGSTLALDSRYRDRDWESMEFEARRQWEAKGRGSWTDFSDAIRYGFDSLRRRAA